MSFVCASQPPSLSANALARRSGGSLSNPDSVTVRRVPSATVSRSKATSVVGYNFENRDPTVTLMLAELRKEQSLDEARQIFIKTLEGFMCYGIDSVKSRTGAT